jgi:hypothetical protein
LAISGGKEQPRTSNLDDEAAGTKQTNKQQLETFGTVPGKSFPKQIQNKTKDKIKTIDSNVRVWLLESSASCPVKRRKKNETETEEAGMRWTAFLNTFPCCNPPTSNEVCQNDTNSSQSGDSNK